MKFKTGVKLLHTSLIVIGIFVLSVHQLHGQNHLDTYQLVIRDQKMYKAGIGSHSVTVNDSIPGPTLYFTEGDSAVIHIRNEMKMASSIHWHGILIPNYFDGVPYLSTPPIGPGRTFTVRFRIRQHGTYWYHSHSMLQEQSGLYGAIVIYPKKQIRNYPKELVLLLSDWTRENPQHILNNLKRNTEWYAIEKGQPQSLNRVLSHHGFGERINMAWNRMPPMDISDVYYNAFLTNGDRVLHISDAYSGERILLRVIDGSSSTFFHLQFSGGKMTIISADGQDVKPVEVDRLLMGVAETYDLLITVPDTGQYELRATAQDGSGFTSTVFGSGDFHPAPTLPKPDLFHQMGVMMQGMAGMSMKVNGMNMRMGKKLMAREAPFIKKDYLDLEDLNVAGSRSMNMGGMDLGGMDTGHMDMGTMKMEDSTADLKIKSKEMDSSGAGMGKVDATRMEMKGMDMKNSRSNGETAVFNYDSLRALHSTEFDTILHPVRELTFNLTGSMWRYIWSINGKTLSEDDSIQVRKGEILRITMNNQTMMYHPMHLHGHFFRVVNANGALSPLKHTVIVPPMRMVTIEFEANEPGNWFFHCHILYHMMTGMARTFQYTDYSPPDTMKNFPEKEIRADDNHWFFWGDAKLASDMTDGTLSYSNRKNWINITGDYGWGNQINEVEDTYERFVTNFLRPYFGLVTSNKNEYLKFFKEHRLAAPQQDFRAVAGIRYLLPFFLMADFRADSRGHFRFEISGETWLFPRIWLNYSWNTDQEYEINLEGRLTQYFSLSGGYHSDYGWGGGLKLLF